MKQSDALPTQKAWDKIGRTPHHGINTPVFSLRSEKDFGTGTFEDLKLLIELSREIGFDVIQLLPLNDSGTDTSPYNSLSAIALNPSLIDLWDLPYIDKFPSLISLLNRQKRYRNLDRLPYHAILHQKTQFLKEYAARSRALFLADERFRHFCNANSWLDGYCIYKWLKEKTQKKIWGHWPKIHRNPTHNYIKKMKKEKEEELFPFALMQYIAFSQMRHVKKYAQERGIFLKGDLPILISPESSDVWQHRRYFDLNLAAGAPPDQFSPSGQYWGFPTYRWEALFQDQLSWWKDRLAFSENFYDIFRIDHIIGLYRMWTIERGKSPLEGSYVPGDRWKAQMQGESILQELLSTTAMLPIGEDLGIDIEYIQASMEKMGIPGTKVLRWVRRYKTDNAYIPYKEYTPYSLSTVSTHDSETLEGWWSSYPDQAREYADFVGLTYQKELSRDFRYDLLHISHRTPSYFHVNLFQEYLDLFPQYTFNKTDDERINIPGKMTPANWSFRMRPTLETLLQDSVFIDIMKSLTSHLASHEILSEKLLDH